MPIETPEDKPDETPERRKLTQEQKASLFETPVWDRLQDAITAGVFSGVLDRYPGPGRGIVPEPPPLPVVAYNDSPDRTARATQELAGRAADTNELTKQLAAAMVESLALSKQAREDGRVSAESSRRYAVQSLVIGYTSGVLAFASAVIALIAFLR
ncbi:hypothetical protein ES689_10675 [Frigoribacterium sp. ACAM 257]|uniref:hypothetical protein n=1 Tax=Frigoribacterium sp. ACAM 257 TaxID=2508998 RepID=UPI0011B9B98E|nr:hypothetical protein [Frigoribacterium sp. ACAM 257]TWX37138.1 hypothetical protein ES689_10675 [Frigoribacterium sp. ACAM 257]